MVSLEILVGLTTFFLGAEKFEWMHPLYVLDSGWVISFGKATVHKLKMNKRY